MKHKILIHSPDLSTPGGKQTYFTSLRDYFQSDVEFFFYGARGKKESFLKVPFRLLKDYWEFYRLLKKNNYDLVHLNPSLNLKSFFRDSIFALICIMVKVKMVVFWHGWQWGFEKKVVRKILFWFKMTYGKANSMIILGKEFSDHLKTYDYKKPIHQVTTVADPMFFRSENKFDNHPLDTSSDKILSVLFLSRIERVKGIYEALDSIEMLRKDHPNIELRIAGTGGELEAVTEYIAKKNIQGVKLLGWITGESKVKAFMESDVYLLPSYHGEGLPCSILEAMATGLPVLSTDVGGIKDFFEDKKMGYLIKMKDPADITEKIKLLINDREKIKSMGIYNIGYAQKRFTPEQVSANLEHIYSETIANTAV